MDANQGDATPQADNSSRVNDRKPTLGWKTIEHTIRILRTVVTGLGLLWQIIKLIEEILR